MDIAALEAAWLNRIPPIPGCFGWEPYDLTAFNVFLKAAMIVAPGAAFFDAGCGIGTKCLLATEAGCIATGIDLVPEFVAEAQRLGVPARVADARDWDYSPYGIVYVNHPLACGEGCNDEALLEYGIHEGMSPGAVLISVNYDLTPGCPAHGSLEHCTDDCPVDCAWPEIARQGRWAAAWVKPS